MFELGQVLRLDARRAALLVTVPALAAVGVIAAWRTLLPGVTYWDNSVLALTASVRLLAPIAAALSAWVAVREHRLDYLRGLTSRSPATGPLVDLLLLSAAALVAYGMVAFVIVGEIAWQQRPGTAPPLGVLAGAAALVLHVVAGYLAGRLLPMPAIVPLAALLTGLWAALRQSVPEGPVASWWGLLPPAAIGQAELFTALRSGVLAYQVLWSVALTVALVTAYVWAITLRRGLIVPVAAALALTGLSTVRLASSGGGAFEPAPVGYVCRHWPLKVCVHPALATALPVLEGALTPLAARLSSTPAAFTGVLQLPESQPAGVRRGVAYVHLTDLTPGYEVRLVREIQAGLVDEPACADSSRTSGGLAYRTVVDAWLAGTWLNRPAPAAPVAPATGNLEPMAVAASTRLPATAGVSWATQLFAGWTESRRQAWLGTHYEAYRTCGLTRAHFH